ncbi:hypothetical protein CEXT_747321 [Caerostris extrusa]|uniref:Uncharacterized protein n=1 Tax=Caerostris extrusa TaxID=172846 RepID=A0AAV4S4F4_CAEEX|nr:hypothetical protein CEXT_747321 [Caerostris extrusa]
MWNKASSLTGYNIITRFDICGHLCRIRPHLSQDIILSRELDICGHLCGIRPHLTGYNIITRIGYLWSSMWNKASSLTGYNIIGEWTFVDIYGTLAIF